MAGAGGGSPTPELSVVVSTLGNYAGLRRVLDGYNGQQAPVGTFELLVVSDLADPDPDAVQDAIGDRPYPVRSLRGAVPGLSANRNAGWRAARAPVVLFTDNDTVPVPWLVAEHVEWHRRFPEQATAVSGLVRWASGIEITPFMRWLDYGMQFDFASVAGIEASWAHLYGANASIKRAFIERVGGYDEQRLPYLYEDIDWAYRAREHGLRVLLNRRAVVDHWRPMTVEIWQDRARLLAAAERQFCTLHPELEPWFWRRFTEANVLAPQRGRAVRLARMVPRRTPWLGPLVWNLADLYWRQQIAPFFLQAWDDSAPVPAQAEASSLGAATEAPAGS